MADVLARFGVLLIVATIALPAEFSDTVVDGLGLALLAYGIVLLLLVVAELSGVSLLRTTERS